MSRHMTLKVEVLGLPRVQELLLAAYDLLQEVEDGDKTLLPDAVVEAAEKFRAAVGGNTP